MTFKLPKDKFMCSVKVGEKGQIVIPKEARDMFDISPGDTLILLADRQRGIAIIDSTGLIQFAENIIDTGRKGGENK